MRKIAVAVISFVACLFLAGCWDKMELDDLAFVQAVAIDETENGKIRMTTHFYKPQGVGSGMSQGQGAKSYQNVETIDESMFEAIRDFTLHVGRKAQWSHMRVLIIGEKLAKKRNIGEILDIMSRDNEPRATMNIIIGKDQGSTYLEVAPFIEQTEAQELLKISRMAYRYTAKTVNTNFLDLSLQLKSETGIANIPYVYRDKRSAPDSVPVLATALIKKGKMVGLLDNKGTESLVALTDQYKNGIIETACPNPNKRETILAESFKTKITPEIKEDSVDVHVSVKIDGIVGELVCTTLTDKEGFQRFSDKIENSVEQQLQNTIELLQKKKLDAIGIGNLIHRQNPALWKRWKPDWEERFARAKFNVDVEVNVLNTGMNIGKPYAK
ncbi:Ger(x)C family spore germination protein [Paenibacillus sp. LHD-38]|uniref:Ger(x)C family spore germination protein n=1 Tax=Paenibacillus sp. LHD-38 TaxID=3072143 RepID=UPI00280FD883|nr:Ger(x)C family spore germination protein [Paenibacillus sp. LHD-38]MDQ8733521.1 Ger(x)C family spore germination protein [Paenibacillus sp. LHD-38]